MIRSTATLLGVAILFLIIALVAFAMGSKGIGGISISVSKVLVAVFAILFVATLLVGTLTNV